MTTTPDDDDQPNLPATTLPEFEPVPRRRMRQGGWSAERQREFIAWLARTGSVRAACRRMGVGEYGVYDLRRHPQGASFRAAWEAALDIGVQMLEDVAMDRALNGVEEQVFHQGELVGTRRVYNDRLLMFILRNRAPKRFAADGARGMSAVDRQTLARLKREWRKEWEREQVLLAAEQDAQVLESLNAKLDLIRHREEQTAALLAEDLPDEHDPDSAENWTCPQPPQWLQDQWAAREAKAPEDERGWRLNGLGERWRE
ncbi:hypothetical protein M3P36_13520 [Altererythrobacter sp. KTW20L]|uniref:hypothetical protein n=1 Tax=Altererythrobacter sp. KTW20L TaxID=2942210 RepID=UPI0020C0DD7D|nr:hypothetical protein [Altererythrobacter sp. KTW20L]MCL6252060.1 hypothetical protein [Altererythrobacter sp. KTW20L]